MNNPPVPDPNTFNSTPPTPPPPPSYNPPPPGTTYVTPPQAPPPPAKNNRTLLYVIIGLVVLCVLCLGALGIAGLLGINFFNTNVQPQLTQMAPTFEAIATQAQSVATQAAQPQPPSSNLSPYITDIILARQTEGDNLDPVDPTTVFQPSDTIHAVAQVEDVPEGTQFKIVWYAEDVGSAAAPNTKIAEYELTASGTRNLDFTLEPNNQWPEGLYRAELFVNGAADRVIRFTVKQ